MVCDLWVVLRGEIVEDYPEDARGHSCLRALDPRGMRPEATVSCGDYRVPAQGK